MKKSVFCSAILLALLAACTTAPTPTPTLSSSSPDSTVQRADTAHNSRNSLDWSGSYQGVTPCADCPGIRTRLSLLQDGRYVLQTQYLDRQARPRTVRGSFTWSENGSSVKLDGLGDNQQFLVGEDQLIMLYQDGSRPSGPLAEHYVLKRVAH